MEKKNFCVHAFIFQKEVLLEKQIELLEKFNFSLLKSVSLLDAFLKIVGVILVNCLICICAAAETVSQCFSE